MLLQACPASLSATTVERFGRGHTLIFRLYLMCKVTTLTLQHKAGIEKVQNVSACHGNHSVNSGLQAQQAYQRRQYVEKFLQIQKSLLKIRYVLHFNFEVVTRALQVDILNSTNSPTHHSHHPPPMLDTIHITTFGRSFYIYYFIFFPMLQNVLGKEGRISLIFSFCF